jgi:hypothetical protein
MMDTEYSSKNNLVLQIVPEIENGNMIIDGRQSEKVSVIVFIPKLDGIKIWCPFDYFQDNCSINEKFIFLDNGSKIVLDGINKLKEVIITIKANNIETELNISKSTKFRLLEYFKLDMGNRLDNFIGFDCHAFVCFINNTKCIPENPEFDFITEENEIDAVVVLSDNTELPNSIKHWTIYLGDNLYLSKFGENTKGNHSQLAVMRLNEMYYIYNCNLQYTARIKENASKWNGTYTRNDTNV